MLMLLRFSRHYDTPLIVYLRRLYFAMLTPCFISYCYFHCFRHAAAIAIRLRFIIFALICFHFFSTFIYAIFFFELIIFSCATLSPCFEIY